MYITDEVVEVQFPFTKKLSENWQALREEYLRVARPQVKTWHDSHINKDEWSAFPILFSGRKVKKNWNQCEKTVSLIEEIPGLITAGYFVLAPGAHLPAHNNHPRAVYRFHLGIVVPDGCSFRVGDETRDWKEGGWLVFDPNQEHEAWNRSDQYRCVLILDVWMDEDNKPFKDVVFHKLDSWRFAVAQTRVGRFLIQQIAKSSAFRGLVRLMMRND